jgi:hypothetical protein
MMSDYDKELEVLLPDKTTRDGLEFRHATSLWCKCGTPVAISFAEALGFDVENLFCEECMPHTASRPRVHLYGTPEQSQDMYRWSDLEYQPRSSWTFLDDQDDDGSLR